MRVLIGVFFFFMLCLVFVLMRPAVFFDKNGQPYGFGVVSPTSRPYSLMILFLVFAVISYYFAAMFYHL